MQQLPKETSIYIPEQKVQQQVRHLSDRSHENNNSSQRIKRPHQHYSSGTAEVVMAILQRCPPWEIFANETAHSPNTYIPTLSLVHAAEPPKHVLVTAVAIAVYTPNLWMVLVWLQLIFVIWNAEENSCGYF